MELSERMFVAPVEFFRIPKSLFFNDRYTGMKHRSILLYMLLLDSVSNESKDNGWVDELGILYTYFRREHAADILQVSEKTITDAFRELVKYDLIRYIPNVDPFQPNVVYVLKAEG